MCLIPEGAIINTSKVSESDLEGLAPGHSLAILLTLNDGHPSEYDDSRPNERSDDFWICSDCVGFVSDLEWNHQTNNLNDQLQNIQRWVIRKLSVTLYMTFENWRLNTGGL